jgi:uncharacterized protein (TIGR00369 family)
MISTAGNPTMFTYSSCQEAAQAAAASISAEIRRLIAARGRAVGLFSAAPAHGELLDCLVENDAIEWTRVIGFHRDEFIGLDEDAPDSSRRFLLDRLVRRVPMAEFHAIRGEAPNPAAVCENLTTLLNSRPLDFAILESGLPAGRAPVEIADPAGARRKITFTHAALQACPRLFILGADADAFLATELRTHASAAFFLVAPSTIQAGEAGSAFGKLLGFQPVEAGRGAVRLRMPFSEQLLQSLGRLHGGALFALADHASGWAVYSTLEPDQRAATLEMKINYIAPVHDEDCIAEARVVHKGRTSIVVESEIRTAAGRLIAKTLATFIVLTSRD